VRRIVREKQTLVKRKNYKVEFKDNSILKEEIRRKKILKLSDQTCCLGYDRDNLIKRKQNKTTKLIFQNIQCEIKKKCKKNIILTLVNFSNSWSNTLNIKHSI